MQASKENRTTGKAVLPLPPPSEASSGQHHEWLTAEEAAAYLKVEPRTLLTWVRQGKVKGYSLSGSRRHVWRFRHVDLDAMLTGPSVALKNGRIQ